MEPRTYFYNDGVEEMVINEDYISSSQSLFSIICTSLHDTTNLPTTINGKKVVMGSTAHQVGGNTFEFDGTNWV